MAQQAYLTDLKRLQGIIRYESKLQWRSGVWMLVIFGYMVLSLVIIASMSNPAYPRFTRHNLVNRIIYVGEWDSQTQTWNHVHQGDVLLDEWLPGVTFTDAEIERIDATRLAIQAQRISVIFLLIGVQLMMADTIPTDRKLNMLDTLRSTPLRPHIYLLGKLMSVWWNTLKVAVVGLLVMSVVTILAAGVFEPLPFLADWLSMVVIAFFVAVLAVCLPAPLPTRRTAIFVGVITVPFVLLAFVVTLNTAYNIVGVVNPVFRFTNLMVSPYQSNDKIITELAGIYGQGIFVALVIGVGTWGLLRLQARS